MWAKLFKKKKKNMESAEFFFLIKFNFFFVFLSF